MNEDAGVAASAAGSSNTLGMFPVSPQPGPTLAVPSSASTISPASDTFDMENICVCCVGMSTHGEQVIMSQARQLSRQDNVAWGRHCLID